MTMYDIVHLLLTLINTIYVIKFGDLFKIDCPNSRKSEVINILNSVNCRYLLL